MVIGFAYDDNDGNGAGGSDNLPSVLNTTLSFIKIRKWVILIRYALKKVTGLFWEFFQIGIINGWGIRKTGGPSWE